MIPPSFSHKHIYSSCVYENNHIPLILIDKHTKKNRKRHPSERLCMSCNMGLCEDEANFILICPLYSNIRQSLLNSILTDNLKFSNLSNPD